MAVKMIEPRDVQRRHERGEPVDVIDVRTPAEYAQLHVGGARSVPLDALDPNALLASRTGRTAIRTTSFVSPAPAPPARVRC